MNARANAGFPSAVTADDAALVAQACAAGAGRAVRDRAFETTTGGANVPQTFTAYRTSASENCVATGSMSNGAVTLKADSVTTLVNGNTP